MLEKVDLVIVGAEGVVESGGVINKVGLNPSHLTPPISIHIRSFKVNYSK